jgi:hypothetical protein
MGHQDLQERNSVMAEDWFVRSLMQLHPCEVLQRPNHYMDKGVQSKHNETQCGDKAHSRCVRTSKMYPDTVTHTPRY